jgi:hypothetical protein
MKDVLNKMELHEKVVLSNYLAKVLSNFPERVTDKVTYSLYLEGTPQMRIADILMRGPEAMRETRFNLKKEERKLDEVIFSLHKMILGEEEVA